MKVEPKPKRAKTQIGWSNAQDNLLIELKNNGATWVEVSKSIGRPQTTCLDRYTVLCKNSVEWDDEMDKRLEKYYQKRRESMWKGVEEELGMSWKAAENRMWDLRRKKVEKK
jgi:folate-binding Fe-S cluster repair protein YgfZ